MYLCMASSVLTSHTVYSTIVTVSDSFNLKKVCCLSLCNEISTVLALILVYTNAVCVCARVRVRVCVLYWSFACCFSSACKLLVTHMLFSCLDMRGMCAVSGV